MLCTHKASDILIKVKSFNELLRMLLICIGIYLKQFRYIDLKFFDTCLPTTLFVLEQGCEDPLLFFEDEGRLRAKSLGNIDLQH
jgi:hypothetical protein